MRRQRNEIDLLGIGHFQNGCGRYVGGTTTGGASAYPGSFNNVRRAIRSRYSRNALPV